MAAEFLEFFRDLIPGYFFRAVAGTSKRERAITGTSKHKRKQAQAKLYFIKASSDRVPITSDRVWRIGAQGQKIVDR